ncbi:MAG: HEAT repeat domain-containing protein [Acidobacteriaceae bacterium]|jgi:predicted CXXCH cytochrome family protein|nr:HEAT repeat domain-containing protein [Acidobacteriaceae bacterium]
MRAVAILATVVLAFAVLGTGLLSIDSAAQQATASTPIAASAHADYVGSDACRACHRQAYEQWQQSIHGRMIQSARTANILGDFSPSQSLSSHGRTYALTSRTSRSASAAPGYAMTIGQPDGTRDTLEIHFTLGEKRMQGYMSTLPDGRMYVLPLFWHKSWQRWIDWSEITPLRSDRPNGSGEGNTDGTDNRQIWNINCFNCHATNIQRNFDVRTRRFATTWSEMGVGCEACHGPGRAHVEKLQAWGVDSASYPDINLETLGGDLNRQLAIFVPRASSPRQVFDSCAYCHGNKTNAFVGFRAGDRLDDFAQFAIVSDPVPANDPQGDYWPDGRPSRFNRPQALMSSGCFAKGEATCATCHAAHGSANEHSLKRPLAESDALCTQCHRAMASSHTHHAPESDGSRCIQCHMSDVNWRLLTRRRDHSFAPPVPELTAAYGIPNACNSCHDDRTPEWAAQAMDGWYGNGDARQRAVRVTDTLYAAGAGEANTSHNLERLTVDRAATPLIRASAAGFLGRSLSRDHDPAAATVNALLAAASDPESMVRIAAVKSLGSITGSLSDRVNAALVARTSDASRVVRALAAEALLYQGITTLPGEAGHALVRAQDEYADSLRAFNDDASRHTALGWLLAARGRAEEADAELQTAIGLDPRTARPHVFRGVLAVRRGETRKALDLFEHARQLDPNYPNIDRLIDMAR